MSKANLYQKISNVMKDVSYLKKDDNIEFKSTKYKAISEEKVTSAVRESLVRHGLVILPIEQNHSKDGLLTTVDTKYKIIDIESGEYEIIVSSGTGVDTQDKGVGKAMTYAYKYLLLRTFAIPTGEDPDKISSAELDSQQQQAITSEQLGELKVKVLEFANLREKTEQDVYAVLKIKSLEELNQKTVPQVRAKLNKWISQATKEAMEEKQ